MVVNKSLKSIFLVFILAIFNIQPANAVENGTPGAEGLAVKVNSNYLGCTGAVWQSNIVITAAHCVIQPSGVLATGINVSAYVNDNWVKSNVVAVKVSKDFTSHVKNIYGQSSHADIAFLILQNKLWDNLKFPNLKIATASDWDIYRTTKTWLEVLGYGFISNSGPEIPTKMPLSGMSFLDVELSAGGKDWAVMYSNKSSICKGDSGAPVIYYRAEEKAIVLVGIISSSLGDSQCGDFQFNVSTSVFTKLSSFSELAAATLNTESKYRTGADVLNAAYENLNSYTAKASDLRAYIDQLPPATMRRMLKNKDLNSIYALVDDYADEVSNKQVILDKSMDFIFINSGVLEANSPSYATNFKSSFAPYEIKAKALFAKVAKLLPSAVCINGVTTKDLPSNKKCPKGYTKTPAPKMT